MVIKNKTNNVLILLIDIACAPKAWNSIPLCRRPPLLTLSFSAMNIAAVIYFLIDSTDTSKRTESAAGNTPSGYKLYSKVYICNIFKQIQSPKVLRDGPTHIVDLGLFILCVDKSKNYRIVEYRQPCI